MYFFETLNTPPLMQNELTCTYVYAKFQPKSNAQERPQQNEQSPLTLSHSTQERPEHNEQSRDCSFCPGLSWVE
jgi:hypothetical protein